MLKQKNFPTVFIYDGSYTDISAYMINFGRDQYTHSILTTDFIYFGRYKPFSSIYVEMGDTVNAVNGTMTVEYYNGSAWASVDDLLDDTLCFSRSGFVQFDSPSTFEEVAVGGIQKYFIRISISANSTANLKIQGMNIVFSDDSDLKSVYPSIANFLDSESTFILRHENSRDLIVQDIRNKGIQKRSVNNSYYENIEPWDLLEIDEVRMWSTYLTLSNIFSGLQSNAGDFYKEKATEYAQKAEFYKAAVYLSVDRDDDGIKDNAERSNNIQTVRLVRG